MGGANQSTCPPATPAASSRKPQTSKTPIGAGAALNPVRFHEVTQRGEVDFHDDNAGLKCAVNSAAFFSAYNSWRNKLSGELMLSGNDGSGGHASVTFMPYVDDSGELQVGMTVAKTKMGKSVLDLDKLAHFS